MIEALWRNKVSWCVIFLIAVGLPVLRGVFDLKRSFTANAPATTHPTTRAAEAIDLPTVMQGKYIVGTLHVMPTSKAELRKQLYPVGQTPMQRLAFATLAGELDGPAAASERLAKLGDEPDARAFAALYEDQAALPADVADRYGFFARLAEANGKSGHSTQRLAVVKSANRAFYTVVGLGVLLVVGGSLGFCLLVTAIVLAAIGKIRFAAISPERHAASAYVQGFALYLALLLGASIALSLVMARWKQKLGLPDSVQYAPIVLAVVVGFAWPLVRGVRWQQMRQDYGLHFGRNVFLEPICGIGGYLAGLPVIAIGMVTTMALSKLSGSDVAHPIVKELFHHPVQILLLAIVFAPITEETLFRGAFVSHLRSFCNPWVAAIVSGVIFATIHPQGWAAIPALGSIGFVLAMIRQWRGSLLASMTAHAINNAAAMSLVFLIGQ